MRNVRMVVVAALVAMVAGGAGSQPAGGPGPMGAGPGASAPRMGMGMGRGAGRWGPGDTPGWALMSPQERNEHRDRMRSMKTFDECKAYQAQHHAEMAARAKERGGKPLGAPRRDPCGALKTP